MVNALKLSVMSSARPNRLDRMGGVPDTGTLVPFPTLSWFYSGRDGFATGTPYHDE
jgi:hypothetical protein